MESFWMDVRFGIRTLWKQPGFAAIVIFTLALGIGANTGVFSFVNAILLRPFPYFQPEQLVRIRTTSTRVAGTTREASLADLDDWRLQNRSFTALGAYRESIVNLVGDGPATPVEVTQVTPEVFTLLGVSPLLGRAFTPEEDRPGGDVNKAVLSHRLWQTRYNSDPTILGRTIRTAMDSYQVIGVMPPSFAFPSRTELWITVQSSLNLRRTPRNENREFRDFSALGRLRAGVTLSQAQAEMTAICARLQTIYPTTNEDLLPQLSSLREAEVREFRPYVLLLAGAVGLVLLICCANVANLLLAKAAGRSREFTLRAALGAGRRRIVQQLLVESLLLGMLGGMLGLGIAYGMIRAFPLLIPVALPLWMRFELDWWVLAFNFAVAAGTGLLFGLAPAFNAARTDLNDVLKEGSRGSQRGSGLRRGLVAVEVAIAMLMLVSAGLLVQSLWRLQRVAPGFQPDSLITVKLSPYRPGTNQERIESVTRFYQRVIERFEQLPGVLAVGGTDNFPFTGNQESHRQGNIEIKGDAAGDRMHRAPVELIDVTPNYFTAMGVPLIDGRAFNENDDLKAPWVMILSKRTADALFPGQSAIGRQVRYSTAGNTDPWATVVGVVGNVKYRSGQDDRGLEMYYPYKQYGLGTSYVALRLRGETAGIEPLIRQAVAAIDPETAVDEIKPMKGIIADTLWQQRLWGWLVASFAVLSLLLAALGIYGVMSYSVSQQTREIGIRMALGAHPGTVLRQVLARGLKLVAVGIALGVVCALALTQVIASFLFGIAATDPLTFVGVALLLIVVALLACYIPGQRAARVDPMIALRTE